LFEDAPGGFCVQISNSNLLRLEHIGKFTKISVTPPREREKGMDGH